MFKPITPPHPPKRPRTAARTPLSRRASSLNMPMTPDPDKGGDRDVASAGNERKKGRIEVCLHAFGLFVYLFDWCFLCCTQEHFTLIHVHGDSQHYGEQKPGRAQGNP